MKRLSLLLLIISYGAVAVFGLIAIISILAIGNPYTEEQIFIEPWRKLQVYKKTIIVIGVAILVLIVTLLQFMFVSIIGSSADRKNKNGLAIGTIAVGAILGIVLLVLAISCFNKSTHFLNDAKYFYEKSSYMESKGAVVTVQYTGQLISSKFAKIWGIYAIGSSIGFLASIVPGAFLFFIRNDNNYQRDEEQLNA